MDTFNTVCQFLLSVTLMLVCTATIELRSGSVKYNKNIFLSFFFHILCIFLSL